MSDVSKTNELIAEARQEASIQDKLGDGFSEGSEDRAFYYEHRDRYGRLADALEAATRERDAAVAAIERIREAVSGHPECDRYSEDDVISCGWKSAYASVVAALDGAPEPEWEYRAKVVHPDWPGNHYIVFKHAPTRDELENPVLYGDEFGGMNQLEGGKLASPEYRRPAGPWLPVEGEKP